MAMGGVGSGSMKYSNSSSRGLRPYALMLLLAFGAAVFGVMVLHKFRERRIFSLLIKDKDRDIITLQLLLQKERDYSKEMKKKVEELKGKAHSLRTQKMDLNNKIMGWQSTAASLKEEARIMEVELEEKKNELRLLKEKEMNSSQDISQVSALTALLKQKDIELQEMKDRLEKPVNVWSVSADDPSNPQVSLTATEQVVNAESLTSKSEGESTDQNATQLEGKSFENGQDSAVSREVHEFGEKNGEPGQSKGASGDINLEKTENLQGAEGLSMREQVGNSNETNVVKNNGMNGVLKEVEGKVDEMPEGLQNVESSGDRGEGSDSVQRMSKRWRDIYRNSKLEKTRHHDEVEKQGAEQDNQTDTEAGDEGLKTQTDNSHQAGLEGKEIRGHLRLREGNSYGVESNEQVGNARKMVSVDAVPGEASNAGDGQNAGETSNMVADDAVEQEPAVVHKEQNVQNTIHRRELPGRRTAMSRKQKVPKATKLRKTWKSTVLEDNQDY
ncbi:hypothetical protein C5167_009165 [Papaver somniferum]|uniref:Uncharacterized protein n=1 Tax=Papaver somniferum TaxID=3469 RepID=A0A4Y7K0F3_PAPSO|nr:uncharacterized protein LOC113287737 [Papaver somniferum]RZC65478.1 hypothetical protein C5167_009165 [Papaver somniferum]